MYAYHHGGATSVGVFVAVRLGIAATVAPFAAAFADRFARERVMLFSDLARVAACVLAGLAVTSGTTPYAVYALATLTSVLGTVFRPAEAALLPVLARTPEELTAANVVSSTFDSVGSFVGPAIAGILLGFTGVAEVLFVVAATFAWSAFFVARIHPQAATDPEAEDESEERFGGLAGGVRAIAAEPRLRLLMSLYGAQCLVAGALGVLVLVLALGVLDLGNGGVGLLEAASGIGSVVGAGVALTLVGRKRLGGDFLVGLVLWGAPLALIGAAPSTVVAVIALGLVGVGNTLVDISAITLLQRTIPAEVAARVFGVLESVTIGSLALGALAVPLLVDALGARGALLGTGALLPVLAALSWRRVSAIDEGSRIPVELLAAVDAVPFLAVLPEQSRELLASRLARVDLNEGDVLFRRGDAGDRFYMVFEGSLSVELADGDKHVGAPGFVGEIALLRDVARTATVRAETAASLWTLERGLFLDTVGGHGATSRSAEAFVLSRLGTVPVS
ncbi:MAG: MFS transporter [Actinobacteria bacterium]|nr:MFS transporter [Actinomycetota bacterium]